MEVLVNNAGYGHEGILEESPLEELRRQFEVNVFGAVAMIKAVLPHMRCRRRGRILNITSMGGFITMPGIAYYCGSKFALEGISEALASEVRDLGIHVTAVAPGSFRTDWAGRSMTRTPRHISDYDALFDPVRQRRQAASGRQPGDPARAARALLEVVDSARSPPLAGCIPSAACPPSRSPPTCSPAAAGSSPAPGPAAHTSGSCCWAR